MKCWVIFLIIIYYKIVVSGSDFFSPAELPYNTTTQIITSVLTGNVLDIENPNSKISFYNQFDELFINIPAKRLKFSGTFKIGIEEQISNFKFYDKKFTPVTPSIEHNLKLIRFTLLYGKDISKLVAFGIGVRFIREDYFDFSLSTLLKVNPDTKMKIVLSNIHIPTEFQGRFKTETINLPVLLKNSTLDIKFPFVISEKLKLILNSKIDTFNTTKYKDLQTYLIESQTESKFLELQTVYSLAKNIDLSIQLNQNQIYSKGNFLFNSLTFSKFNLDSQYYSAGLGTKINYGASNKIAINFLRHLSVITLSGYAESWPLTTPFIELIGEGKVTNFNSHSDLNITELNLSIDYTIHKNIGVFISSNYFYADTNKSYLDVWKRKSGIIGLLEPGEYERLFLPAELQTLHLGKFLVGFYFKYKFIQFKYYFNQIIPFIGQGIHQVAVVSEF